MVVIDTSVAYKWFSIDKEEHISYALKLLEAHLHNRETIIAPDIIIYELSNAWATKTRLSVGKIETFLEDFEELKIKIEPVTFELIGKAICFAKKYHVSVYDASYAVLAKEKKCDLVTADSKFSKQTNLPFIKSLDKYSI